jgi:hypothetical protein
MIKAAIPPASTNQTTASKSFVFMATSHESSPLGFAQSGWDLRDSHHVPNSLPLNHRIVCARPDNSHLARGETSKKTSAKRLQLRFFGEVVGPISGHCASVTEKGQLHAPYKRHMDGVPIYPSLCCIFNTHE